MIAVALSPKARALIQTYRDVRRPTADDQERVAAALRARLGSAVLPLDPPISARPMSNRTAWRFVAACGLCLVGAVLYLNRRPEPVQPAATTPLHVAIEAAVPFESETPTPSTTTPLLETPQAPQQRMAPIVATQARAKLARPAPAQDTLAEELILLTSATTQLNSGQAQGALLTLEQHQRRFAHGVLSDERNVAKARALCVLHRFDEGRAALASLPPGTPFATRTKEECDAAWARANPASAPGNADSN